MYDLAVGYVKEGMSAYVKLQEHELALEKVGYTAVKHQREVGTGYFDEVSRVISGGKSSTLAPVGSAEEEQFHDGKSGTPPGLKAPPAKESRPWAVAAAKVHPRGRAWSRVDWVWNGYGVPGLVAGVLAAVLAGLVYFAAPTRTANRRLALLLCAEAVYVAMFGVALFANTPRLAYATKGLQITIALTQPALYLLFLATLDTPLVRFLRGGLATGLVVASAVVLEAAWFLQPSLFIAGLRPADFAAWDIVYGPFLAPFIQLMLATSVLGLVVAISAYRRATTEVARRKAKAYLWAFGTRDVGYALVGLGFTSSFSAPGTSGRAFGILFITSALGIAMPLLAYGILRAHLFDIDVKIKWGVKRGTLAGIFLAVFFVVGQLGQNYLSAELGLAAGGVAAGLMLFVLSPLQKFAQRVADAAMPNVRSVGELGADERLDVYREQLRAAWADGVLTADEQRLLRVARDKLRLSPDDALRVEREVAPS